MTRLPSFFHCGSPAFSLSVIRAATPLRTATNHRESFQASIEPMGDGNPMLAKDFDRIRRRLRLHHPVTHSANVQVLSTPLLKTFIILAALTGGLGRL